MEEATDGVTHGKYVEWERRIGEESGQATFLGMFLVFFPMPTFHVLVKANNNTHACPSALLDSCCNFGTSGHPCVKWPLESQGHNFHVWAGGEW